MVNLSSFTPGSTAKATASLPRFRQGKVCNSFAYGEHQWALLSAQNMNSEVARNLKLTIRYVRGGSTAEDEIGGICQRDVNNV